MARSGGELRQRRAERESAYARVAIDQHAFDRALDVQALLADGGHHRGVSLPDLLIAAAAESAGLPVLHYDADYELIAAVTGQPAEWVVPRGSVP
jgi:predicted nucleic acid-binding protein